MWIFGPFPALVWASFYTLGHPTCAPRQPQLTLPPCKKMRTLGPEKRRVHVNFRVCMACAWPFLERAWSVRGHLELS